MEQTIAKPTTAEVDGAEKVLFEMDPGPNSEPDGYWRPIAEDVLAAAGRSERVSLEEATLSGAYSMCARLLTSPRFNRPQREIIEEQAYEAKDKLEALGVSFSDAVSAGVSTDGC